MLSTHVVLQTRKYACTLLNHWRVSTECLQRPPLIEPTQTHMGSDLIQSALHHMSFNIYKIFFLIVTGMEANESGIVLNENQSSLCIML